MITVYSGLPGCGKSYILVCEALRAMGKGRSVFSNFPIFHPKFGGTLCLTPELLHDGIFPFGSLLIIDEAGSIFSSRDWKNFSKKSFVMFTQHRHQGYDLMLGVQHPQRLDVSIREITNIFYWITKYEVLGYILGMKAVGYTDLNYLGRSNVRKNEHDIIYDTSYYVFKKSRASCYNTLALRCPVPEGVSYNKWRFSDIQ